MSDALKRAAAAAALGHVRPGMRLGIGTGSTAEAFIRLLAARVAEGFAVTGVTTSTRSEELCRQTGVPTTTLDDMPQLDLTVDGADEIGPDLALIKGGGAALLREKIVAGASAKMIVIADASKLVKTLGAFPLPVEINRFGAAATVAAIERATAAIGLMGGLAIRENGGRRVVTDEGHFLVDASFGRIPDPASLSRALLDIPGVVQHGLFLGMASLAIVAGADGVRELRR
jgi:ribose 5-phosphate isomerase A